MVLCLVADAKLLVVHHHNADYIFSGPLGSFELTPSDLADTIWTVPGLADAFTGPLQIERIDTCGPSVAFTDSVSVFMNGA